jgi:Amiloride-sensitive sodium channel
MFKRMFSLQFYFFSFAYTQVTIYFKETQFLTSERRELYGSTDFLANCGGLLGLFLGVSVMSFLEIAYFCTIRLFCNLKSWINNNQELVVSKTEKEYPKNKISRILKQLITDYSSKTTIQGINYATDANLSLIERFWWTIVVILSVLCCGSLIIDVIQHYDQSPIIVSYANQETSISDVN